MARVGIGYAASARKHAEARRLSAKRFANLRKQFISVAAASKDESMLEFAQYLRTVGLSFKAREALIPASKKAGEFLDNFSATSDGSSLAGIDSLLPDPSEYKN